MSVSVTYKLTGTGWSECYIAIGENNAYVSASYLDDALGDLLRGVVALIEGANDTTVSFAEEPGEYRWRLRRIPPDKVGVCILVFDELWGNKPDEEGQAILAAECRLLTFAGAVLSASQRVLEEHGIDGYAQMWVEHEFPLQLQERLKHLLKN